MQVVLEPGQALFIQLDGGIMFVHFDVKYQRLFHTIFLRPTTTQLSSADTAVNQHRTKVRQPNDKISKLANRS